MNNKKAIYIVQTNPVLNGSCCLFLSVVLLTLEYIYYNRYPM